jgi:hypothetical protein
MNQISVKSLLEEGFTEDTRPLRRFERKYGPISVLGVLSVFGGFYTDSHRHDHIGIGITLIGFGLVAASCIHAAKSTPESVDPGRMMERYRRIDCAPEMIEYVYVDRVSRTFCTRWAGNFEWTGIFRRK